MTSRLLSRYSARRARRRLALIVLLAGLVAVAHKVAWTQAPVNPLTTWSITIVLPPRVVAGEPATLATLGVDGRLAPGIVVDIGDHQLTTDRTGRAAFVVPPSSSGYLIAKASGGSFATLVDPQALAAGASTLTVAPAVALHDRFAICGAKLGGDTNDDLVKINGQLALVLAASPECLVVLPGPKAAPGSATISVVAPGLEENAATSLVSLEFEAPNPPLEPEKKGQLIVRAEGSNQPLRLIVDNETPGVLRFEHGEALEIATSGGTQNVAAIKVQAITSGDFSFHARLLPAPDVAMAQRYLLAAERLAPRDAQHDVKHFANHLAHHPRDFQAVAASLDDMISSTIAGDFRTLLSAARAAL